MYAETAANTTVLHPNQLVSVTIQCYLYRYELGEAVSLHPRLPWVYNEADPKDHVPLDNDLAPPTI